MTCSSCFSFFLDITVKFSISKFQMAGEVVGKSQAKIEPKKMTLVKIMPTVLFFKL